MFYVPRLASSICEADVIDLAGYTISLVILPPNASFEIAPDGSEAVKVLHGLLGWVDSQSEIIERSRVACAPGCVTLMLVDSPEGHVRSGDDGAVLVRMRPSDLTDATSLKALNVLPSYFPCDVRAHEFSWRSRDGQDGITNTKSSADDCTDVSSPMRCRYLHDGLVLFSPFTVYHLPGFRVRFHDGDARTTEGEEDEDVSSVHFWATRPGSSTPLAKDAPPFSMNTEQGFVLASSRNERICSIRASLSNPSGEGGLLYCDDDLGWGLTPPTSHQISRARKLVLPVMYEHGPLWRTSKLIEAEESAVGVEYPWHSWVSGRSGRKQTERARWDIWAVFDFPAFEVEHSQEVEESTCIIC